MKTASSQFGRMPAETTGAGAWGCSQQTWAEWGLGMGWRKGADPRNAEGGSHKGDCDPWRGSGWTGWVRRDTDHWSHQGPQAVLGPSGYASFLGKTSH
jgi:hypothetical protein